MPPKKSPNPPLEAQLDALKTDLESAGLSRLEIRKMLDEKRKELESSVSQPAASVKRKRPSSEGPGEDEKIADEAAASKAGGNPPAKRARKDSEEAAEEKGKSIEAAETVVVAPDSNNAAAAPGLVRAATNTQQDQMPQPQPPPPQRPTQQQAVQQQSGIASSVASSSANRSGGGSGTPSEAPSFSSSVAAAVVVAPAVSAFAQQRQALQAVTAKLKEICSQPLFPFAAPSAPSPSSLDPFGFSSSIDDGIGISGGSGPRSQPSLSAALFQQPGFSASKQSHHQHHQHPLGPFAQSWVLNPYSAVSGGGNGPMVSVHVPASSSSLSSSAVASTTAGGSTDFFSSPTPQPLVNGAGSAVTTHQIKLGGAVLPIVDETTGQVFASSREVAEASKAASQALLKANGGSLSLPSANYYRNLLTLPTSSLAFMPTAVAAAISSSSSVVGASSSSSASSSASAAANAAMLNKPANPSRVSVSHLVLLASKGGSSGGGGASTSASVGMEAHPCDLAAEAWTSTAYQMRVLVPDSVSAAIERLSRSHHYHYRSEEEQQQEKEQLSVKDRRYFGALPPPPAPPQQQPPHATTPAAAAAGQIGHRPPRGGSLPSFSTSFGGSLLPSSSPGTSSAAVAGIGGAGQAGLGPMPFPPQHPPQHPHALYHAHNMMMPPGAPPPLSYAAAVAGPPFFHQHQHQHQQQQPPPGAGWGGFASGGGGGGGGGGRR